MKKKIAILVSENRFKDPFIDDILLKNELESRGFEADIIYWDCGKYDFASVDLAIIRSCWDYYNKIDDFLERMKLISQQTLLVNSYETVLKYCNKTYLNDLKDKGIPIIDSEFLTSSEGLKTALSKIKTNQIIIKPTISASGMNIYKIERDHQSLHSIVDKINKKSEVMLQPFMETINSIGEKSTIIIDNEVVLTMKKKPAAGEFLVHKSYGGSSTIDQVDAKDLDFINKIIVNLPDNTAYVRIDYMFNDDNQPLLSELELIEPCLYLYQNPKGLKYLSDYITNALQ